MTWRWCALRCLRYAHASHTALLSVCVALLQDIPLFLTSLIPIEGEEDHHHHHGHGKHHHDKHADASFMASMQVC